MTEQNEIKYLEVPEKYEYLGIFVVGEDQFATVQDVCTDGSNYTEADFPEMATDENFVPTAVQLVPLYAREQGVAFEIVNEAGPGGGWPEVKFVGTLNSVLRLLEHHMSEPSLSADYYAWVSAGKPKV